MKISKTKAIILLTIFIDVIGLGVIVPVLPFYVESFGASPLMISLLFSAFALFSFLSSPLLGALSDKIGRRPVLIISIASTALGLFVFASAKSVWVLFLGRIIDGMAAGNFPIAQSYMVDIAKDEKERTTNLGLIGAAFGMGFIVGPAIGATLGNISLALPFWFVGIMATLNMIGAYFFLPETLKKKKTENKIAINPLLPIINAAKDKALRSRYIAWMLFGTAFAGMQAIFALFAKDVFGLSAIETGYLFMMMGVVLILNQGFALKKVWLHYFRESDLEIWFFWIMIIGFLLIDSSVLILFGIGIVLVTLGQSTLRVVMSSSAAGVAGKNRRGEVLGIMASIMSASMVIGPIVAGALFEIEVRLPYLLNIVMLFVAFLIMKGCCGSEKIMQEESVEVIG